MEAEVTTNEQGDTVYDVPSPQNMSAVNQLKSDPGFVDRYLNGDQGAIAEMSAAIESNGTPTLSRKTSSVDQLKSNPDFVNRYLNGDPDAIAEMTSAMSNQAPALSPPETVNESISTTPEPDMVYQKPDEPGEREYHAEKEIQLNFGMIDGLENIDTAVLHQTNLEAKAMAEKYDVPDQMVQPFSNALARNAKSYDADANVEELQSSLHERLQIAWGPDYDDRLGEVQQALEADPELDSLIFDTNSWHDPWVIQTISNLLRGGF